MEKVSRRKFVATAAVAGAAAVLRPPAFAFENQGPGAGAAVVETGWPRSNRAASESVSHEECETPAWSL